MNTEELNALKDRAYKTAVEHGFHEEEKSDAFYLGLVMSEAGEAINADRKGRHADIKGFEENFEILPFEVIFKGHIKDSVEDDFAGLKEYELRLKTITQSDIEFLQLDGEYLPADLFFLMGILSDAHDDDDDELETCISGLISILSSCFKRMTGGSDCDLWWFVKQKMRYNELRPKLNGKLY